jgi:hypothetical protein
MMDNLAKETPAEQTVVSPSKEHERFIWVMGAYAAFVAALFVATITTVKESPSAWIAPSRLVVSLPTNTIHGASKAPDNHRRSGRSHAATRGYLIALASPPEHE